MAEIGSWAAAFVGAHPRGTAVVVLLAALIALNLWRLSSRRRRLRPQARWRVSVDGDVVANRRPDGGVEQVSLANLERVLVETDDTGPWVLLEERSGTVLAFPQGATGEAAVLERLAALPGFDLKGTDATENARVVCWKAA